MFHSNTYVYHLLTLFTLEDKLILKKMEVIELESAYIQKTKTKFEIDQLFEKFKHVDKRFILRVSTKLKRVREL